MKIVNLIKLVCKRCGWSWTPRGAEVRICPRCKSKLWDKERGSGGKPEDSEDDAFDHNTYWGGAGPDCKRVRRESAEVGEEEPPIIWSRDSYGSFLESKEKA